MKDGNMNLKRKHKNNPKEQQKVYYDENLFVEQAVHESLKDLHKQEEEEINIKR